MHIERATTPTEHALQREFAVHVAGETVPGVLWTPAPQAAGPPRALIVLGHGGAQHKTSPGLVGQALRYAQTHRWASLAIDAPGHGERISLEEAERGRAKTLARARGQPIAPALSVPEKIRYLDTLAAQAVPEWQAALGAVLASGLINPATPVAYWGVSMGSSIGIPLLAADQRFRCAVLGLAQLHPEHVALRRAAEQIAIPLQFAFQWDDPIRERAYGLALFDAFGSREKAMHIHPGGHLEVPQAEVESWERFFERQLG